MTAKAAVSGRYAAFARSSTYLKASEKIAVSSSRRTWDHANFTFSQNLRYEHYCRLHSLALSRRANGLLERSRHAGGRFKKSGTKYRQSAHRPQLHLNHNLSCNHCASLPILWSGFGSRKWLLTRAHEERRFFSMKTSLNLPLRPPFKPSSPPVRPSGEAPAKPSLRPATPSSPSIKSLPLPSRPLKQPERREEMLQGVTDNDKEKQLKAKVENLRRRNWDAVRQKLNVQIDVSWKQALTRDVVHEAVQLCREKAASDYRILNIEDRFEELDQQLTDTFREVRSCVEEVVRRNRMKINMMENQRIDMYSARFMRPREKILESITTFVLHCRYTVQKMFLDTRQGQRARAEKALEDADELVDALAQLKDTTSKENDLKMGINELATTVEDITKSFRARSRDFIRQGQLVPPRLVQILYHCDQLARIKSLDQHEDEAPHSSLRQIAHQVRKIEKNMTIATSHEDITFSDRWARSVIARFVWLWRSDCDSLFVESMHAIPAYSNVSTHYRNPRAARWLNRFEHLTKDIQRCSLNSDYIAMKFAQFVGDGSLLVCPHPQRSLHLSQLPLTRKLAAYEDGWSALRDASAQLTRQLQSVIDTCGHELVDESIAYRSFCISKVKDLQFPPHDQEHLLSRRAFHQSKTRLLVYHGLRIKYGRLISFKDPTQAIQTRSPREEPMARILLPSMTSLNLDPVITSTEWLKNRSLYPTAASIPIDYVASSIGFSKLYQELAAHDVVGVDALALGKGAVEFIILSTTTKIYILAIDNLRGEEYRHYKRTLRLLLENRMILKVGTDYTHLSRVLWEDLGIWLTSFYDVSQHLKSKSDRYADPLLLLINQTYERHSVFLKQAIPKVAVMLQNFPKSFFSYLALRAYAPLKILHAYNTAEVLMTTDKLVVDTREWQKAMWDKKTKEQLGPVNIDGQISCFNRPPRRQFALCAKIHAQSRNDWLRSMGTTMAEQQMEKCKLERLPEFSAFLISDKQARMEKKKGLTAYFLSTVFAERLPDIAQWLGFDSKAAARWILWSAEIKGLRLNDNDRNEYEQAAGIRRDQKGIYVRTHRTTASTGESEALEHDGLSVENQSSATQSSRIGKLTSNKSQTRSTSRKRKRSLRKSKIHTIEASEDPMPAATEQNTRHIAKNESNLQPLNQQTLAARIASFFSSGNNNGVASKQNSAKETSQR